MIFLLRTNAKEIARGDCSAIKIPRNWRNFKYLIDHFTIITRVKVKLSKFIIVSLLTIIFKDRE